MKIIRHVSRVTRYALLAVLLGSALALSVIRFWLLPEASRFRTELAIQAGDMLGESVRIGAISARMQGLEPQLVLRDFTIIDTELGTPALSFRRVHLGIDLLRSVLEGAPAMTSLRLEGARVAITRQKDGRLSVRGVNPNTGPPIWLLFLPKVELRGVDLEWQDLQAGTPVLSLGRLDLYGSREGLQHRLSASIALAEGLGGALKLHADLQGESADPAIWSGRLYLEGNDVRPAGISERLPFSSKLRAGSAEVRVWADLKDGQIVAANGSVNLNKPMLSYPSVADTANQLALDELGGRFNWRKAEAGWRFAVDGLRWVRPGEAWPKTDLAVEVAGGEVRAAISYLRLEHLRMFLDLLPSGHLREALDGLAPRGELRNARLVYGPDESAHWGVCAEFEGVAIDSWSGIPGVDQLDGRLCGNDRRGRADVRLHDATLISRELWPKPLRVGSLNGELQWSQDAEKWRIAFPTVEFDGPGLQATASGAVELPKAPEASPFLDLRARLADVDAAVLRDYLPLVALGKNASAWLSGAFDAGRVKSAEILFFGSLADFPFRAGQGVFQALAEVENLELDFDPEWPHLTGFNGRVRFEGPGMSIDARSGAIGGAPIRGAHAQTLDFDEDPWLTVAGEVDASIAQSMSFLASTPLSRIPERLLSVTDFHGNTSIELGLKIPLVGAQGDVRVDGLVRLKSASLSFPSIGLHLAQINGDLHFTDSTLSANGIRAVTFGSPVRIDLERAEKAFRVDLQGTADIADLREEVPGEIWAYLDGAFNYQLNAEIPDAMDGVGGPLRMVLTSDLSGLDVLLPEPLGKRKTMKRRTRVELAVQPGSKTPLRIAYGDDTHAQLWLADVSRGFALVGGGLSIGGPGWPASSEPGLRLRAKLPDLDASAWRRFLFEQGKASLAAGARFKSLVLEVGRVQWEGEGVGPLALDLQAEGRDWKGAVEAQVGKGHYWLQVPEHGHPVLKLDMDVLNLPAGNTGNARQPSEGLSPDRLPIIQVSARQTYWRGADLGALELLTERWAQGINIKQLSLRHRNHDLQLRGTWLRANGRDETRIDGKLNIMDMGRFLASLGYAKEIRDTTTEAQFSLSWPGAPHQLSASGVTGEIDLDLGRGSVLKMEPGLGRAFAVLNLDSLRRLLMLDFSDIFGKGLAYDGMRGHFELGGGQARTSGFLIDAVAAVIVISGRVGLVQKDLDETVTVTPHTLASLPVAGAMVGGAAVGAAISMAGKLIGQDSVSIASNRYAIRGSWDDPQVSRIEGNMPLDVLDRAWSGLKNLSGFGSDGAEESNE